MRTLSTDARVNQNKTINIIKGISIILVIFLHFPWSDDQLLHPVFPYILRMSVPAFMIISGYLYAFSYDKKGIKGIEDGYNISIINKRLLRYSIPYLIFVIWELIDPHIKVYHTLISNIKWFLYGTGGPGTYYYPILIQLIFVYPVIYFLIRKYRLGGVLLCLVLNAIYEILRWAYDMNVECYRLLVFRYIFVISLGTYAFFETIKIRNGTVMTIIGFTFITLTTYLGYSPIILNYWTSTCFIASMFAAPLIVFIIKRNKLSFMPLEIVGKSSYNIFLVQIVYYVGYSKYTEIYISDWRVSLITGTVLCVTGGIIFYYIETPFTKWVIRRFDVYCRGIKRNVEEHS